RAAPKSGGEPSSDGEVLHCRRHCRLRTADRALDIHRHQEELSRFVNRLPDKFAGDGGGAGPAAGRHIESWEESMKALLITLRILVGVLVFAALAFGCWLVLLHPEKLKPEAKAEEPEPKTEMPVH